MVFKNVSMNIDNDATVSISNEPRKNNHRYSLSFNEEDISNRRLQLLHDIEQFDEQRQAFELYMEENKNSREDIINQAVEDANIKRDMMLKTAVTTAESVRRNALHDAVREVEVLKHQGYQAGFEQGKEECLVANKEYTDSIINMLDQINQSKVELFSRYEKDIVKTLLIMVEKVTSRMISEDNTIIMDIVKQAAKNFRNSDNVRVTVSGMDFERILPTDFEFLSSIIPKLTHISVELSNEMASGGVILDNGTEIIDASTFTQLDFLAEIAKNSGIQSS